VVLDGLEKNKMCIEVYVQVLQSDGGLLGAAITGASLALADAGIAMRDLVCGSSSAVMKIESEGSERYVAVADPSEDEILSACGVVTIAMMPNWKEVTVWDQFGKMSFESSTEAVELARDGCLTLARFVKNCLNPGDTTMPRDK
jgi:ribonuclease PH